MMPQLNSWFSRLSDLEKRFFPWKVNQLVKDKPAFFPGCNMVNFMPETTLKVLEKFRENDSGFLFDCCGKPLGLKGDPQGTQLVINRIQRQLDDSNVPELVVACPNCLQVFQKKLKTPVVDIYTYLEREGIESAFRPEHIHVFTPCPDRASHSLSDAISRLTGAGITGSEALPCCGLGIKDADQAKRAMATLHREAPVMHAYCASCYGHLVQNGVPVVSHLLSELMGIKEAPSSGLRKISNRIRPRFWRQEAK